MKKKISIQQNNNISDCFEDFIRAKKAQGLATTYRSHFQAISHHLDTSLNIFELNKRDFEQMISSMRDAELAPNSIKSYTRTLRSFFSCAKMSISAISAFRSTRQKKQSKILTPTKN